jgi:hypothetical protein
MKPTPQPVILVVDDELEDGNNLARQLKGQAEVSVCEPPGVKSANLEEADLVLVDYDLSNWSEREKALSVPPNGLALAQVFRQRIDALPAVGPKGVALYSGEIGRISANLPDEVRAYAVARLNNLEWVFEKDRKESAAGVVSLASAVSALPGSWPEGAEAIDALHQLLGLNAELPFFATAADDVAACHPPIHELSAATHALAVIRWLAQRILPYPAFLMDRWALSARLRIDPSDLERALDGTALGEELHEVAFSGALCDLVGPHWWRAGVDNLIFKWTQGAGGAEEVRSAVQARSSDIRLLDGDLVAVIDDSYRATKVAEVEDSVRLRPDDWPAFAGEAWALADVVRESERLRGLVLPADQDQLE